MIPPHQGAAVNRFVNNELGNTKDFQLYNLKEDAGQRKNVAEEHPEMVKTMFARLKKEIKISNLSPYKNKS